MTPAKACEGGMLVEAVSARETRPTPSAADATGDPGTSSKRRGGENLRTAVAWEPEPSTFPTPSANDAKSHRNRTARRSDPNSAHHPGTTLTDHVTLWSMPSTSPTRPNEGNVRLLRAKVLAGEMTEEEAAAMLNGKSPLEAQGKIPAHWPTPAARDWKSSNASEEVMTRNSRPLNEVVTGGKGGQLNPDWVELLMGFPPGWTVLE